MRRLAALLTLALALPLTANAQDLDDDRGDRRGPRGRDFESEVVREIERGPYLKASVGSTIYLGARGKIGAGAPSILRPGTTLVLTAGGEFIDREKLSVAAEFNFYQAIHNGLAFQDQGAYGLGPNRLVQGDVHVFATMVGVEASAYPVRRLGIGGHLGGGVAFVPLLMNRTYYDEEVVGTSQGAGAWGGPQNTPSVHQGVKGMIYVGPTIEYYTKLSHFSIGIEADFLYAIGLDFGVMASGFLKYTF